ncbi:hypothetical protein DFH09DRAFT_1106988 [Mycena vulgaris]|nr:hypothetical protein DFH09DRAFT_1106988 [Mycena vulgaris]
MVVESKVERRSDAPMLQSKWLSEYTGFGTRSFHGGREQDRKMQKYFEAPMLRLAYPSDKKVSPIIQWDWGTESKGTCQKTRREVWVKGSDEKSGSELSPRGWGGEAKGTFRWHVGVHPGVELRNWSNQAIDGSNIPSELHTVCLGSREKVLGLILGQNKIRLPVPPLHLFLNDNRQPVGRGAGRNRAPSGLDFLLACTQLDFLSAAFGLPAKTFLFTRHQYSVMDNRINVPPSIQPEIQYHKKSLERDAQSLSKLAESLDGMKLTCSKLK